LSPIVVTEFLSDPKIPKSLAGFISELPRMEISNGFWERAAKNRARLIQRGLKARLVDTLIAQNCIDSGLTLIARDGDYRHFFKHCRLKLVMATCGS
jgi:predicted nucleic acid-binding protein